MKTKCECGGSIKPDMDKIGTVLGGTALITVVAAAFGLGGGWIALGVATFGGNAMARHLLNAKVRLVRESSRLGSFFKCSVCKKDFGIIEIFD